jgi:hypothetical protein
VPERQKGVDCEEREILEKAVSEGEYEGSKKAEAVKEIQARMPSRYCGLLAVVCAKLRIPSSYLEQTLKTRSLSPGMRYMEMVI